MSSVKFAALFLLAGCAASPLPVAGPAPVAPAAAAQPAGTGSVARGAALVQARCTGCHAVGLTGNSPLAIAPPFRELSRRYPISSLQESLAEGLVTAHPEMPEFAFDPDQVLDIMAYLENLDSAARSVR
jgi:cytochrome c